MCKTKPIYPRAPGNGRAARTGRSRRGAISPNKPNLAVRSRGQGPNVRNKPNFPAGPGGTRLGEGGARVLYKQTQFLPPCRSGGRRSREGKSRKTKPISGVRLGPEGETCETKPNLGKPGCLGDRTGGRAQGRCVKQTQFPAGPAGTGPRERGPIAQNKPNLRGQMCRTKPISTRLVDRGVLESAAVCRRHLAGPATGQSRCPGCRRGVDSWSVPADADGPMNTNE
jgi:hypothetical protein